MAVALEVGVIDLLLELPAHALGVLRPFQSAGAVPARAFKALPYSPDDLLIRIQCDFHATHLFLIDVYSMPLFPAPHHFSVRRYFSFPFPAAWAAGISRREFEARCRTSFDPIEGVLEKLVSPGYVKKEEDRWCLTPEGFLVSNQIIGQALEALETEKRRRAEAAARGDYRIR